MKLTLRRPAFSAALISALFAALCLADASAAGTAGTEVARVMGREQSALGSAAARVTELTEAMRPLARDAEDITVASRSVEPGTVKELSAGTGDAQAQCLAQAIYFESRGEPLEGQIAVAEVVLNRVDDRSFPDTVCGVTRQGVGSGRGCQFSYACDGNSDTMKSALARERSLKLASTMLAGRARTVTDGATYFHTRSISPSWSRRMTRTATIGHHLFYRAGTRVAGG